MRLIKNLELGIRNEEVTPSTPLRELSDTERSRSASGYYVDTFGQLRFKPIKLGSRHPMYYIYRTDKIFFDALTRTFDRAEMNIIKFYEKIFG